MKTHLEKARYCRTCKIMRPPNSSHCSFCDNCVRDFDHHCFFIGNCVAERTHKYFVMFLTTGSILIIYTDILSLIQIICAFQSQDDMAQRFLNHSLFLIIAVIALFLSCCFASMCKYALHWSVGMLIVSVGLFMYVSTMAMIGIDDKGNFSYYDNPVYGIVYIILSLPLFFWICPLSCNYFKYISLNLTKKKSVTLQRKAISD